MQFVSGSPANIHHSLGEDAVVWLTMTMTGVAEAQVVEETMPEATIQAIRAIHCKESPRSSE